MKRAIINKLTEKLYPKKVDILDIGTGDGEIPLYLARIGHRVLSITNNMTEVVAARAAAAEAGIDKQCQFEYLDAAELHMSLNHLRFDAVVMTNVLQEMERSQQIELIDHAKQLTHYGGFHAVSGYVVDPEQPGSATYQNALAPGQLLNYYAHDPSWGVLDYHEDEPNTYLSAGRMWVDSHADLLAQKIIRPRLPTDNF